MLTLRDIMTSSVLTFEPETVLRDAARALAGHHLSGAPVVEHGRVVGVASTADIVEFLSGTSLDAAASADRAERSDRVRDARAARDDDVPDAPYFTKLWANVDDDLGERLATVQPAERELLAGHTVEEVMDRRIHAMRPDTPVPEAADQMRRAGFHRMLVMDDEELVGVVTTMDLTMAAVDHRLESRHRVGDRGGSEAP